MDTWFTRRTTTTTAAAGSGPDDGLPGRADCLTVADRACCCPAMPVVTVMMPPTPDRPHRVELLLCGHHYRVSLAALRAAGAGVYDRTGALVLGGGIPGQREAPYEAAGARGKHPITPVPAPRDAADRRGDIGLDQ